MTAKEKILSLTAAANTATGKADADLTAAMASLIDGYGQSGVEKVEWHQCPEAVRNYLDNVDYTDDVSYTRSDIESYIPTTADEANTKPIAETVSGDSHRNEVPNRTTPFASEIKAGTLKPLDRLRWINTTVYKWVHSGTGKNVFHSKAELEEYVASTTISDKTLFVIPPNQHDMPITNYAAYYIYDNGGLHFYSYYPSGYNARDLGGWNCDGGSIKYGLLIRGGEVNPADKHLMVDEIGIKTEVRLFETSRQGLDYSAWDIDMISNPTDSIIASELNTVAWRELLKGIIGSVLHSKPVYYHCGQGADRTGAMSVMLEGILGVNESDISKDYELTSFSPEVRKRSSNDYKGIINRIKSAELLGGLSDTFRNYCISFALSLGITIGEINAFRAVCIDGYDPIADDVLISIASYTVSNDLSGCKTNNSDVVILSGASYSAIITADNGYTLNGAAVTITMGGTDITSTAYSNGAINISNVTGNIVITVYAVKYFVFSMDRTVMIAPASTTPFFDSSKSSLWDESKVIRNYAWATGQTTSTAQSATLTDISVNSVTSTSSSAGGCGATYPIQVTGGKTYTLSFNYGGDGATRVGYAYNVDGNTVTNTRILDGANGETGSKTATITIPNGTTAWLFLTFGANTGKTKSYTNVTLLESD